MHTIVQSADDKGPSKRWFEKTLPKAAEPGRRGFQDWLEGSKPVADAVIAAFAYSISSYLSVLGAALLSTVRPSPRLMPTACGTNCSRTRTSNPSPALYRRPPAKVTNRVRTRWHSGGTPILHPERRRNLGPEGQTSVVFWKSAHGSHTYDKRKELSARARALRFTFDGSTIRARDGINKLILVIDGTFEQTTSECCSAGWDQIFYPDEMDELVEAID